MGAYSHCSSLLASSADSECLCASLMVPCQQLGPYSHCSSLLASSADSECLCASLMVP